jgi:pyroglutamyl-peptidase
MPRLLMTGFEPWGGISSNPSGEIAAELGEVVLPVDPKRAAAELLERCKDPSVGALLMLGLDRKRDQINIERCAYNLYRGEGSDQDGAIVAEGPSCLESSAPYLEIETAVVEIEPRSLGSTDPGAFVCNYLYYTALYSLDIKSVFIHLPEETQVPLERQIAAVKGARDLLLSASTEGITSSDPDATLIQ